MSKPSTCQCDTRFTCRVCLDRCVERNLADANATPLIHHDLFLIEFYTNGPDGEGGWDINFAWVYAPDKASAIVKLSEQQGTRFDCVITCERQSSITPLAGDFRVNTPDANLFILS